MACENKKTSKMFTADAVVNKANQTNVLFLQKIYLATDPSHDVTTRVRLNVNGGLVNTFALPKMPAC